jgi:hypothetical protein
MVVIVAFRIFDVDNDGIISQKELVQTLRLMAGNNLTEAQLNIIGEETINAATLDGSSEITVEHFINVWSSTYRDHTLQTMTLMVVWVLIQALRNSVLAERAVLHV